uniref:Uncharacterized protein n=1 Tax=Anguilla anguilla TaxID=7936 RepID=A0A0E9VXM0_ANGAN
MFNIYNLQKSVNRPLNTQIFILPQATQCIRVCSYSK